MGQYFKAVNLDRREYVCPWCLGCGAKLWEWAANPQGAIFTLLLRKSDQLGGGDIGCRPIVVDDQDVGSSDTFAKSVAVALAREGVPAELPPDSVIGSWAEDRVALVGDYDSSNQYFDAKQFTNISERLVREWNAFIELDSMQLTYHEGCSCLLD